MLARLSLGPASYDNSYRKDQPKCAHAGRQASPHILPRPTTAKHMYRWDLQIEHACKTTARAPRREAEAAGLVRWEAGQGPQPPHQPPQRRHQTLCTPEMHNTACIVPSGFPAIL